MKILNLLIMTIFALILSYFLPIFINLLLPVNQIIDRVRYSPVVDEFMLSTIDRAKGANTFEIIGKGAISEDEFVQNQPFTYHSILIPKGQFPKIFKEYESNASLILKNSQILNLRPSLNLGRNIPLYVLLRSDERYGKLSYFPFLIRLGDGSGMQIIDANKNQIDQNLSSNLNEILASDGFKFPAKQFFSNPTTLKAFDEGAFIVDSGGRIFHLKFDGLNFTLKDTGIVKNDIINIIVSEHDRREFYALVITPNELGLIDYDYKYIPLPNEGYDPTSSNLNLKITPINKIISFSSPQNISTYVMDLNYTLLKQNVRKPSEPISKRYLKGYVLPFETQLVQEDYFYKFKLENFSAKSLFASIVLALAFFVYNLIFLRKKSLLYSVFVVVFGIYGFIAAMMYTARKE
ncbi:DUF4857 domain-containing protein [Campylobacter curvus]|uniref:DUF4857 domain-containing protein n=1 Tax=Campylobacter curvus TaxID=200 RepID=UPI00147057CF|nr:DUF4857 domain-containing protein [Campylobacter curvus]